MDHQEESKCHCGSRAQFEHCCAPFLRNEATPETPEQLMRSRYSAYVLHNADYLIETWHPDCNAQEWRQEMTNSFEHTQWVGLRVISSSYAKNADEGYVEFSACFIDEKADHKQLIHERSRFIRLNSRWYYLDGITPKVGRNDLCPCGSGKKYKKCCE
ncbi:MULTISPECIES: YchJ family protein [Providencia]|uniref:YchJ family protein n=1 Tax=Providencia TaxID=586 RepID=UPI00197F02D6|nr:MULTISPECIES: YchJ family protein [Providencia]HEC8327098.1 YchJ family protein [Providencia rettgeri]MBN4866663.1 YchJ family protein [Providencia stuartii]MBN4876065.1 YchJ family protein [Providencia stuartii]MBN4880677.1 YchJ family protein [Providencia stuartii]MBN4885265.1 YchJ family protein [Providencia stuartii]